jgi:hypothetical protein
MARRLFRLSAPVTESTSEPEKATLMANSVLYGENIRIIPVVIEKEEENSGSTESQTTVVIGTSPGTQEITGSTGIRVTGTMSEDAVLTVSGTSSHVGCPECKILMENHQIEGRIFVNLEISGEHTGELRVQIPATGKLAAYEGREIVILTCRGGKVWAIQGTVINGFIVFYTDELGSFLIVGDHSEIELSENRTHIILDQQFLTFAGWM